MNNEISAAAAKKTAKMPYYSFCVGRGSKAHSTLAAAEKAAKRSANAIARKYGGAKPAHSFGLVSEIA